MDNISGKDILEMSELEKKYENMFKENNNLKIYPNWWDSIDYQDKKEIVSKAIEEKRMIKDLKDVQKMQYDMNVNKLFNRFEKNVNGINKRK